MQFFAFIVFLLVSHFTINTVMSARIPVSEENIAEELTSEHEYNSTSHLIRLIMNGLRMHSQNRKTSPCSNAEPSKRINCGWPGISHQECTERWCCFDESKPAGVPTCFINEKGGLWGGRHTKDAQCDFSKPHLRTDCGYYGISPEECEARGCCADSRVEGSFARHCFFSSVNASGNVTCGSDDLNCTVSTRTENARQCLSNQWRCNNGKCIKASYKCDGDFSDCGDGSDEENCTTTRTSSTLVYPTNQPNINGTLEPCERGYFKCRNGQCIRAAYQCYGDNDCGDGSDEIENCRLRSCRSDEWKCKNGRCILASFKCDGDITDCGDGSDEENCPLRECTRGEFECKNRRCIRRCYKCDGDNDCGDGSDEENCPARAPVERKMAPCSSDEWECNNGRCIDASYKCDGDISDCGDGSDEHDCPLRPCTSDEWQCENGRCIRANYKCDGDFSDCGDGSDEKNCTLSINTAKANPTVDPTTAINETVTASTTVDPPPCLSDEWRCDNGQCIERVFRCDFSPDCQDGSDEIKCGFCGNCSFHDW